MGSMYNFGDFKKDNVEVKKMMNKRTMDVPKTRKEIREFKKWLNEAHTHNQVSADSLARSHYLRWSSLKKNMDQLHLVVAELLLKEQYTEDEMGELGEAFHKVIGGFSRARLGVKILYHVVNNIIYFAVGLAVYLAYKLFTS